MESTRYTFKKEERLSNITLISNLFKEGNSLFVYPFKVMYLQQPMSDCSQVQLLLVAPKRTFRRAVDRNRVKRLMREAYRVNKHILINASALKHQQLLVGLVYVGKTILTYAEIEKKLILILHRLSKKDEENIG